MSKRNLSRINLPEKYRVLSGASLKWIAMISMLIDHLDKGILANLIIVKGVSDPILTAVSSIFEILGRVAFPIFLYMLVEGFLHTRSVKKYLMSLLAFGVVAEIPYDMFESGEYFDWGGQNMYFTLALALVTLWLVDRIMNRWKGKGLILAVPVTLVMGFLASFLALDYHFYGVVIPVIFYLTRKSLIVGSGLSYLVVIKELWSILGFATLNLYNGKRGRINKWFCYAFYPAHLLIIGLIRMFIMIV